MAKKYLSLRRYATHRGCTLRAVQKAIQTGRIKLSADGKIDPVQADRDWALASDPSKQRGKAPPAPSAVSNAAEAFARARAVRETANAKLAQLNYETKAGRLVDAEAVRLRAFENARLVRDAILNIPNRLAAELAGETDAHKIHTMLTVELTRALEELVGNQKEKARAAAAERAERKTAGKEDELEP